MNPENEDSFQNRIAWKLIFLIVHKISTESWWHRKWDCFIKSPAPCDACDPLRWICWSLPEWIFFYLDYWKSFKSLYLTICLVPDLPWTHWEPVWLQSYKELRTDQTHFPEIIHPAKLNSSASWHRKGVNISPFLLLMFFYQCPANPWNSAGERDKKMTECMTCNKTIY